MFDSIGAFTNQFTPVEGGYIYYPSKKDGGKFVTADEYEQLLKGWRKVAGRRGTWTIAGIAMLAIILWTGNLKIIVAARLVGLDHHCCIGDRYISLANLDQLCSTSPRPESSCNRAAQV